MKKQRKFELAKRCLLACILVFAISMACSTVFYACSASIVPDVQDNFYSVNTLAVYTPQTEITPKEDELLIINEHLNSFLGELETIDAALSEKSSQASSIKSTISLYYEEVKAQKVCSDANRAFNKLAEIYNLFLALEEEVSEFSKQYNTVYTDFLDYITYTEFPEFSGHRETQDVEDKISETYSDIYFKLVDFYQLEKYIETMYVEAKQIADDFFEEYFDLSSRLAFAEAGCIKDGKYVPPEEHYNVVQVVENRIKSPKFPDNLHDVVFQKGQYSPARSGSIKKEAPEYTKKNVEDFLRGRVETGMPDNVLFQAPFKQGKGVWKHMEVTGHYFCYG